MKNYLLSLLIVGGLLYPILSEAREFRPLKKQQDNFSSRKIHPLESILSSGRKYDPGCRNGDKLLVLLIEFNDEELETDNPETTGLGKFQQEIGNYPIMLDKPPHDHHFFSLHLEAMKYYYHAASLYYSDLLNHSGFDLEYDIYPLPDSENIAFTLPQSMAYYTPSGASFDLLISRFEEYFYDAFTIADQDENIDFSQYEHFMLIHAGSDWQHDIFGNTPSDMPSFFIQLGEGKEVIVDNGTVIIDHACNVPETITQDIEVYEDSGFTEYYGYGVINSVMVHEFGHSLGFIDLYNTSNFYPGVGYYDIMDSGGLGRIGHGVDLDGDDEYDEIYYIEGGLPSLPGVWSRLVAWEEDFRARGILKDLSEINMDEEIFLTPSENKYDPYRDLPYFIKIPLNEFEYLLLENRQLDPDGDGGTLLWDSADGRVILHPTPISDDPSDSTRTYEYDYLLPGWFDQNGNVIGGGLLIWHIDERIIYEQGNYENNTVNSDYYNRGVKIIEADNISDIGNPYSYFWRGTEYEPFYKYKPILTVLSNSVIFDGWDIPNTPGQEPYATHNDSLAGATHPPLLTNDGYPSIYTLYDISSYEVELNAERLMSLKIGLQLFDHTTIIANLDPITAVGYTGNTEFFTNNILDFPVVSGSELYIYHKLYDENTDDWFSLTALDLDFIPDKPITRVQLTNGIGESFLCPSDNSVYVLSNNNYNFEFIEHEYSSTVIDLPLYINEKDILTVVTEDIIYFNDEQLPLSIISCVYDGENIIGVNNDGVHLIDPENPGSYQSIDIPAISGNYVPICYSDSNPDYNAVFILNDEGNLYRINSGEAEQIFNLSSYCDAQPTQLALGNIFNDDQVFLIFAAGERLFALTLWGSLVQGFPSRFENINVKPFSFPRIVEFSNQSVLIFEDENDALISFDNEGIFAPHLSSIWNNSGQMNQFYWDQVSQRLYFIYIDAGSTITAAYCENMPENPILWNGYRHNDYSIFYGSLQDIIDPEASLNAYAYPNPASKGEVRIRVENPKSDIGLKIFDIAGNIILSNSYPKETSSYQDIVWNTKNISSGMYFAIVRSGKNVKKIALAIEN